MRSIVAIYLIFVVIAAALAGGCFAYYRQQTEDPFKADATAFIAAARSVK